MLNSHPDIQCQISYVDPFHFDSFDTKNNADAIDQYIQSLSFTSKQYHGNIPQFGAYELQHAILTGKTKSLIRYANIAVNPLLRLNFLIHSWLNNGKTPKIVIKDIENNLSALCKSSHSLFNLYQFNDFFISVLNTAKKYNIDTDNAHNRIFLIALALVITFDSADLPTPCKVFSLEKLIDDKYYFAELIQYICENKNITPASLQEHLSPTLASVMHSINQTPNFISEAWQKQLIHQLINSRLKTIFYPHIDKPLIDYYKAIGYALNQQPHSTSLSEEKPSKKLISIQLNSNRPTQLMHYFDNIEETADNPAAIEVLVNIDEGDIPMENLLTAEIIKRKFAIKYISSPKPKSFCDLWMPINKLLTITDPDVYFLLNISDEMLFATKGWDTKLKNYIGFFPDHLFRLRASRNKFRNYFDRWECNFAQDSIPITTKAWIDAGGDWNPCFGPDSFQQLIAFYLAKEGMFSNTNYLRDIPILDIHFAGDVPCVGVSPVKSWKIIRDHIISMQICQSYPMQLEARRRAMIIKCKIKAHADQIVNYDIINQVFKKKICLLDKNTNTIIYKTDYSLSRLKILSINQFRKLYFFSYFGGGKEAKFSILRNCLMYLKCKYYSFYRLYLFAYDFREKSRQKRFITALKPDHKNAEYPLADMTNIKKNI